VFYRTSVCSGERLRPNFNWPVPRAIGGYKRVKTENNWEITNPQSADHGGVLHGGAKNRGERDLGTTWVFRWTRVERLVAEARDVEKKPSPSAIYRPTTGIG
jgi:hypothetical protein